MRSLITSEAGLQTRASQWWGSLPFITSSLLVTCAFVYLVCLLFGYDSFGSICFSPSAVISHFQVYRIYTSVLFHGTLLHVLFNMLAFIPLGTELERIMGSLRLLHLIFLLATSNAIFHIAVAVVADHNPLHSYDLFMNECAIGFSGIIFSLIVIETNLSGLQSRSVFGLFNVPSKWYAWILLVVFQLMMTNVSLLGHLCGILSGFAYTYGFFNFFLGGTSFYSSIESLSVLSPCVRQSRYILCTGGPTSNYLPTHINNSTSAGGAVLENVWRGLTSFVPQREANIQDSRFPGRGHTLGSVRTQGSTDIDGSLEASLLETDTSARRPMTDENATADISSTPDKIADNFDEKLGKLVAIGFEKTQAEVALAAADGDPNLAAEILMSQQA